MRAENVVSAVQVWDDHSSRCQFIAPTNPRSEISQLADRILIAKMRYDAGKFNTRRRANKMAFRMNVRIMNSHAATDETSAAAAIANPNGSDVRSVT